MKIKPNTAREGSNKSTDAQEPHDTIGSSDTRTQQQWTHQIQCRRLEVEHHGNQPSDRPATLWMRQDEATVPPQHGYRPHEELEDFHIYQ